MNKYLSKCSLLIILDHDVINLLYYKKFAISLQYCKRKVSDEVDFLHADKHEHMQMGMVKHS